MTLKKIFAMGGYSLAITLPKSWIDSNGIRDVVNVEEKEGKLIITKGCSRNES